MGPADSRRIPRAPRYSGAGSPGLQVSRKGLSPAAAAFSTAFRYRQSVTSPPVLQPRPRLDADGLGSCAFARHYLRNRFYFLFLRVLRCFSSPRSPRAQRGVGIAAHGFPHSDTAGSQRICRSPAFFAACHVLLRLREPQASPVRPCSTFLSFF